MKTGQSNLITVILILLLTLIMVSSVEGQSFDSVFKWINRFQKGENIELITLVDSVSFTFYRDSQTNINQSTFESLLDTASISQIKFLTDKANKRIEGFVLRYEKNNLLRLEETFRDNRPSEWKKVEFVRINSFPLKYWKDFIKQAIPQGLMEYKVIDYNGQSYASFTFKQTDSPNLQFGKRQLIFSDEFYEYMKISKEFQPKVSTSDKIVILVHEPHWLLIGQYQLIPGLKAFIEANSQHKFRFLVEGYYEEEIKYIPTKPTLDIFIRNVSTQSQVFNLLNNFLIDGPFAYRLLYSHNMPALAIDDTKAIKNTPREPKYENWSKQREVLINIIKKLERFSQEQQNKSIGLVNVLTYYISADANDLKGEAFIDYYEKLAELYGALSAQLKSLNARDFSEESSFLESQARSSQTQVKIYQYALVRDTVMADNIISHFGSEHANLIPIAFIGNFHTPGIINKFPNNVSYVVIEPRISPLNAVPPQKDRDKFNNALNLELRPRYLKNPRGSLKLQVAPLNTEMTYYASFLRSESQKIATIDRNFRSSSPLSSEITSNIKNILEQNGNLCGVQVRFANGGQIPPTLFQRAFASFSYGSEGLILYDRNENNWNRQDRLNFIKNVLFIPCIEEYKNKTIEVRFYQVRGTGSIFSSIFDPNTQKYYLFEGEEVFNLLNLFRAKGIHYRLSIP